MRKAKSMTDQSGLPSADEVEAALKRDLPPETYRLYEAAKRAAEKAQDESARRVLTGLSLAEHSGDVNEYLPRLARLLGEAEPEWSDEQERYVFPWESHVS